ncbi:MAG: hypothetical protein JW966_02700 [Anaerolineae bacterium]|nr:hypothetical protein [Anaerolineae bacterium]
MSRLLNWSNRINPETRLFLGFMGILAVCVAAFLFGVGLEPDSLPFPPGSDYSDAVTSHWSNALFLRRAVLHDHAWPLWRPLLMSGQPFAANPLNKAWYPPQWLVFVLPPAVHLNVLIALHLLAAGTGMWLWSRTTGLSPWAAALAGLGYTFAPRVIAALGAGHLDIVYAAAWCPWLLWAVVRLVTPHPAPGAPVWLAAAAALCFLADVRLSAYALVMAAAYLVWRWWQVPDLRTGAARRAVGGRVLLAGLITLGLTAVQWVPLLLLRADLSRGAISRADSALDSLTWGHWAGLLIGNHGGAWETLIYTGISTLVLAVIALLLRPRKLAFWGIALLVIALYAMGDHFVLWPLLVRLVPPLRWWRVPPRIWLIAALIVPYLAGWGAQALVERPRNRRNVRLIVVTLLGGGLVCSFSSLIVLTPYLDTAPLLGTFALPAVALLVLLAIQGKLPAHTLLALFVIVVLADVLWIDRSLVDGRSRREWLDPYRELAAYLEDAGAVRVYSPSYSLPQQAAAYWDIAQFGGVDPFQLADYVTAAEEATGVVASGYSVTIPAYEISGGEGDFTTANRDAPVDAALLGRWLVTHVVSAFPLEADGLVLNTRINGVYVYRNMAALPVSLAWDGPNRVTITAAEPVDGPVFAVTNEGWQDAPGDDPGLPGHVDSGAQQWTYAADPAATWLSLLVASIVLLAAGCGWWMVHRA